MFARSMLVVSFLAVSWAGAAAQLPEPERHLGPAVPTLVGRSQSQAEQALRSVGLKPVVLQALSQEPPGTVVEQRPRAGASVRPGTSVRLFVSRVDRPPARPDAGLESRPQPSRPWLGWILYHLLLLPVVAVAWRWLRRVR